MGSKMVKIALLAFLLLALLFGLVIGFVVISLDSIAKGAIEKGGTYALGVETRLDSASVRPLSGRFALAGLSVKNPEGFKDPYFLELGDGKVAITLESLSQEQIELPELNLDAINVTLIKEKGGANYEVILENLKKISGEKEEDKEPDPAPSGKPEKTFVIRQVNITDVNVKANMIAGGGDLTSVSMKIDKIELKDVGEKKTITADKLAAILMQALITAIFEEGGGILPDDIMGGLKNGLGGLESLGDMGVSFASGAGEQLQKLGDDLSETLDKNVGGAIEDATKGLGGLLGGDKDDEKKDDDK